MYRMIATTFWKAAAKTSSPVRVAGRRGRRKGDATVAVIGAVLVLFFLIEFGWVIAHPSLPGRL